MTREPWTPLPVLRDAQLRRSRTVKEKPRKNDMTLATKMSQMSGMHARKWPGEDKGDAGKDRTGVRAESTRTHRTHETHTTTMHTPTIEEKHAGGEMEIFVERTEGYKSCREHQWE
jgi:hypothetical protein